MRILLLDDSPRHRRAGIQQLEAAGHEVVALFDYTEAVQQARDEDFDVALIDLLMPAEPTTLGPDAMAEHVGREIGVGFPMALIFAQAGIPLIAVATDSNHHAHPMSAIMDWLHGAPLKVVNVRGWDSTVVCMHAPMTDDGAKNYIAILQQLTD